MFNKKNLRFLIKKGVIGLSSLFISSCIFFQSEQSLFSQKLTQEEAVNSSCEAFQAPQSRFIVESISKNDDIVTFKKGEEGFIKEFSLNLKARLKSINLSSGSYVPDENSFVVQYRTNLDLDSLNTRYKDKGSAECKEENPNDSDNGLRLCSIKVKTQDEGFIQWQEHYKYEYYRGSVWLRLLRDIKQNEGNYPGLVEIPILVNPWFSQDNNESNKPQFIDVRSGISLDRDNICKPEGLKFLKEDIQEKKEKPPLWIPEFTVDIKQFYVPIPSSVEEKQIFNKTLQDFNNLCEKIKNLGFQNFSQQVKSFCERKIPSVEEYQYFIKNIPKDKKELEELLENLRKENIQWISVPESGKEYQYFVDQNLLTEDRVIADIWKNIRHNCEKISLQFKNSFPKHQNDPPQKKLLDSINLTCDEVRKNYHELSSEKLTRDCSEGEEDCYGRFFEFKLRIPLKIRILSSSSGGKPGSEELIGGRYKVESYLLIEPKGELPRQNTAEAVRDQNYFLGPKKLSILDNCTEIVTANLSGNHQTENQVLENEFVAVCRFKIFWFEKNSNLKLGLRLSVDEQGVENDSIFFQPFEGIYDLPKENPLKDDDGVPMTLDNEQQIDLHHKRQLRGQAEAEQRVLESLIKSSENTKSDGLNLQLHNIKFNFANVDSGETNVQRTINFVGDVILADPVSDQALNSKDFYVFIEDPKNNIFIRTSEGLSHAGTIKTDTGSKLIIPIVIKHNIYDRQRYFKVKLHFYSAELNLLGNTTIALNPWQRAFQSFQQAQNLPPEHVRFNVEEQKDNNGNIIKQAVPKPKLIINQFRSINLFPSYGLDKLLNIHLFHRFYLLFQPFITRPDNVGFGRDFRSRELLRDGYYLVRVLILRNPKETDTRGWEEVMSQFDLNLKRAKNINGIREIKEILDVAGDRSVVKFSNKIDLQKAQYLTHTDSIVKSEANFVNFYMPLHLSSSQFYYIASRNIIVIEIYPADPEFIEYHEDGSIDQQNTIWKPYKKHELINQPYAGAYNIQNWDNWNLLQPAHINTDEVIEQHYIKHCINTGEAIEQHYKHFNLSDAHQNKAPSMAVNQLECIKQNQNIKPAIKDWVLDTNDIQINREDYSEGDKEIDEERIAMYEEGVKSYPTHEVDNQTEEPPTPLIESLESQREWTDQYLIQSESSLETKHSSSQALSSVFEDKIQQSEAIPKGYDTDKYINEQKKQIDAQKEQIDQIPCSQSLLDKYILKNSLKKIVIGQNDEECPDTKEDQTEIKADTQFLNDLKSSYESFLEKSLRHLDNQSLSSWLRSAISFSGGNENLENKQNQIPIFENEELKVEAFQILNKHLIYLKRENPNITLLLEYVLNPQLDFPLNYSCSNKASLNSQGRSNFPNYSSCFFILISYYKMLNIYSAESDFLQAVSNFIETHPNLFAKEIEECEESRECQKHQLFESLREAWNPLNENILDSEKILDSENISDTEKNQILINRQTFTWLLSYWMYTANKLQNQEETSLDRLKNHLIDVFHSPFDIHAPSSNMLALLEEDIQQAFHLTEEHNIQIPSRIKQEREELWKSNTELLNYISHVEFSDPNFYAEDHHFDSQWLTEIIEDGFYKSNSKNFPIFTNSLCAYWMNHFIKEGIAQDEELKISTYENHIKDFDYLRYLAHASVDRAQDDLDEIMTDYEGNLEALMKSSDEQKCHRDYAQCIKEYYCFNPFSNSLDEATNSTATELEAIYGSSSTNYCKEQKDCENVRKEYCDKQNNADKKLCEVDDFTGSCSEEVYRFCTNNPDVEPVCNYNSTRCSNEYSECLRGIQRRTEGESVFALNVDKLFHNKEELIQSCQNNFAGFFNIENKIIVHDISTNTGDFTYKGGFLRNFQISQTNSNGSFMNWEGRRNRSVSVSMNPIKGLLSLIPFIGITTSLSQSQSSSESNSVRRGWGAYGGDSFLLNVGQAEIGITLKKFQKCLVIKPQAHAFFASQQMGPSYKEVWNREEISSLDQVLVSRPGLMLCQSPKEEQKEITETYYYVSQSVEASTSQFLDLYNLKNRPFTLVLRGQREFLKFYNLMREFEPDRPVNESPRNMFIYWSDIGERSTDSSLALRVSGNTGFHPGIYDVPSTDLREELTGINDSLDPEAKKGWVDKVHIFDIYSVPPPANKNIPTQE